MFADRAVHRSLAVVSLALALVACSGPPPVVDAGPAVSEETSRALVLDNSWNFEPQAARLELGVTHTQFSLDATEPAESRQRGFDILADHSGVWQNHHLMGFGTLNPEPSPGVYDWSTLDRRMQVTKDSGARTVLTACCAPDWMKGGAAGGTDWSRLEDAPYAEYFDAYAELTAQAVLRYPQVERLLVWNELKGFYNTGENRWDYEAYTALYNKVYTAVKAVRPDVQIGGPYVVLISLDPGSPDSSDVSGPWGVADQRSLDVVEYWLANNVGSDFIAVDAGSETRQKTAPASIEVGAQKFADLTAWVRERTPQAIWWAEFYPEAPDGVPAGPADEASAAATLSTVAAFAESGVSIALLWGPQGHSLESAALWTDATVDGGGLPTPLTRAWQWLVPRLADGGIEIGRSPTSPLLAFRAADGALVVNTTGEPVEVVPGVDPLPAWAATLIPPSP